MYLSIAFITDYHQVFYLINLLLYCTAEAPRERSSSFCLTVIYQITCVYTLTLSFSLGFLLSQVDVNGANLMSRVDISNVHLPYGPFLSHGSQLLTD
jgi:hypothetical protein